MNDQEVTLPQVGVCMEIPADVETMFHNITSELISKGYERFSADAILHRIRWYMRVDKGDREFKVNNNWSSELSRRFTDSNPRNCGFFEQRQLKRLRASANVSASREE